jgi:hypothetical protein
MHPLQAYSSAFITHQADVPIHIQASRPLTPMSSMRFLGVNCYILQKFSFGTVFAFNSIYGGNLLPFLFIHSMTVTFNLTCGFHCHLFFPFEI